MNATRGACVRAAVDLAGILLASSSGIAAPLPPNAFAACPQFFFQGVAPDIRGDRVRALCFSSFAVLHSGVSKTPIYVAEHLTRAGLLMARKLKRKDHFYEEARLPYADRAKLPDYRGSGWDRGHMAAAADAPTEEALAQSFSLANMIPQAPVLNRGAWAKQVEGATRKYAMRSAEGVFVLTGPIFRAPVPTIGDGNVWIPQGVFKLVYDPAKRRAWAFVMKNEDSARAGPPVSYATLVSIIGAPLLAPGALRE